MKTQDDSNIAASKCFSCEKTLDRFTAQESPEHTPSEGDISVCAYCSAIGKFNKNLSIVELEDSDFEYIKKNHPEIYMHILANKQANGKG
jgi:hypothetical protein